MTGGPRHITNITKAGDTIDLPKLVVHVPKKSVCGLPTSLNRTTKIDTDTPLYHKNIHYHFQPISFFFFSRVRRCEGTHR